MKNEISDNKLCKMILEAVGTRPQGIQKHDAECKRCGKIFQPKQTKLRTHKMTTCCEACEFRNILDGLDLPTPPSMVDRHTKNPTLTDAEWQ